MSYLESSSDFFSLSRDNRRAMGHRVSKTTMSIRKKGMDKKMADYREARAEVLRKLYEENPVEEHMVCIYKDPIDGRKSKYEMDAVEENPYSPFDDLEKLETLMPKFEDYI